MNKEIIHFGFWLFALTMLLFISFGLIDLRYGFLWLYIAIIENGRWGA